MYHIQSNMRPVSHLDWALIYFNIFCNDQPKTPINHIQAHPANEYG